VHNLRDKLSRLAGAVEELAKHGPAKPPGEAGLDEFAGKPVEKGPFYLADPLGNRTGNAPSPQLADVLRRTVADGVAAAAPGRAAAATALTVAGLQEHVDLLRGAVTMAYPGGLPAYDVVAELLADAGGPDGAAAAAAGAEYFDPATATLWWAGKEFFRDATVGDRVGRNEKTKVIARLQRPNGGPPVREPAVSEAERAAMMAMYFKKQEEAKALAENDDDAYHGARWADPKALKRELLGATSIGWRGPGGK